MSGVYFAVQDVATFHTMTETPIAAVPAWPSDERMELRVKLITEEVRRELIPALEERDMVGVADGIADSIYVLIGTALELGIPLPAVWNAVQRANEAKAIEQPDGRRKVVRREDGKILKPEGWQPPDIEGILREAGWTGEPPLGR